MIRTVDRLSVVNIMVRAVDQLSSEICSFPQLTSQTYEQSFNKLSLVWHKAKCTEHQVRIKLTQILFIS